MRTTKKTVTSTIVKNVMKYIVLVTLLEAKSTILFHFLIQI